MSRTIKLMIITVSILLLLASCSQEPLLNPKKPVAITMWHYYVGESQLALEQAVDRFNQSLGAQKGIIVLPLGFDTIADLEASVYASAQGNINSNPMPELFSSYLDIAFKIHQLNGLVDLNTYYTQEETQQFIPSFLEEGQFEQNQLLVLPIVKSTELLYLNYTAWDAFAQATGADIGALSHWNSIYQTAKEYYHWTDQQSPDLPWNGNAFLGFDSVANFIIVSNRQAGIELIKALEDGTGIVIINEQVLKEIFALYFKGISLGYFGAGGKFRSDDIKSGTLVSYVGSTSGASHFPSQVIVNNQETPIHCMPIAYPLFFNQCFAITQGAGMCVAKSTPQKQEAAVEFLKWFTSQQENIRFALTTGYLPVIEGAYTAPEFSNGLENLQTGNDSNKVVAKVYQIAFKQMLESDTYAVKPFQNSYDVRTLFQSTLVAAGKSGFEQAAPLKSLGYTEEEILDILDVDAQFSQWLLSVKQELDKLQIPYILQQP